MLPASSADAACDRDPPFAALTVPHLPLLAARGRRRLGVAFLGDGYGEDTLLLT